MPDLTEDHIRAGEMRDSLGIDATVHYDRDTDRSVVVLPTPDLDRIIDECPIGGHACGECC